jgi:hypothetical protein
MENKEQQAKTSVPPTRGKVIKNVIEEVKKDFGNAVAYAWQGTQSKR